MDRKLALSCCSVRNAVELQNLETTSPAAACRTELILPVNLQLDLEQSQQQMKRGETMPVEDAFAMTYRQLGL